MKLLQWQSHCQAIKDRGEYIMKSGVLTDCCFLVGSGSKRTTFYGHKMLLAMASPIFESMFENSKIELDNPIEIEDVEPDVFRTMLTYIYTDKLCLKSHKHLSMGIMSRVAIKYQLFHLNELCKNLSVIMPHTWQSTCASIADRGEFLLTHGRWADCNFQVGNLSNWKVFKAHKLLLAMASPVFDAMFNGKLPERNNPIVVSDIDPDVFQMMLTYIYTDQISVLSVHKVCDLWYLAEKYMITSLVQKCVAFVIRELCVKNACRVYEVASLLGQQSVVEKSWKMIITQTEEVLADESFLDIELATLLTIVNYDTLFIKSELVLFLAVTRYAMHNGYKKTHFLNRICNDNTDVASAQQQLIHQLQPPLFREVLKKIRFLTIAQPDFSQLVIGTNILTKEEESAIKINLSFTKTDTEMPPGFSIDTTDRLYNCPNRIGRQNVIFKPYSNHTVYKFQADRPITVFGLKIYTQINPTDNLMPCYEEDIYIEFRTTYDVRLSYAHCKKIVRYESVLPILFNVPATTQRDLEYMIIVTFRNGGMYTTHSMTTSTERGITFSCRPNAIWNRQIYNITQSLVFEMGDISYLSQRI